MPEIARAGSPLLVHIHGTRSSLCSGVQIRRSHRRAAERHQVFRGLSFTTATLGYAYAKAGKRREARKVLQSLKQRSGAEYVPPFCVALVYAGLGDRDQEFACIDPA